LSSSVAFGITLLKSECPKSEKFILLIRGMSFSWKPVGEDPPDFFVVRLACLVPEGFSQCPGALAEQYFRQSSAIREP